jgi:Ca-activated chloride channel family protein
LLNPKQALAAQPLVVRMRHKPAKNALHAGSDEAIETTFALPATAMARSFEEAPENFRFAAAVGAFAEILRQSPHAASFRLDEVGRIAASASRGRKDRVELASLV